MSVFGARGCHHWCWWPSQHVPLIDRASQDGEYRWGLKRVVWLPSLPNQDTYCSLDWPWQKEEAHQKIIRPQLLEPCYSWTVRQCDRALVIEGRIPRKLVPLTFPSVCNNLGNPLIDTKGLPDITDGFWSDVSPRPWCSEVAGSILSLVGRNSFRFRTKSCGAPIAIARGWACSPVGVALCCCCCCYCYWYCCSSFPFSSTASGSRMSGGECNNLGKPPN